MQFTQLSGVINLELTVYSNILADACMYLSILGFWCLAQGYFSGAGAVLAPPAVTRAPSLGSSARSPTDWATPCWRVIRKPTILCCIIVTNVFLYRAHSTFAPCGSQHSDEDILDQSWYCRANFNGLWVSAVVNKDWSWSHFSLWSEVGSGPVSSWSSNSS